MSVATRHRAWVAVIGLFALLVSFVVPTVGGLLPAAAAQTVPDREFVLGRGHIDGFETTYDAASGKLVLSVKDDTRIYDPGSTFREPGTTTFAYEDERLVTTLPPATGGWAFLGAYGGTQAWLGTQSGGEQGYAPWVGWSTERLPGTLAGTGITPAPGQPVSLDVRIEGPGDVFAFMNGSFGAPINRYVDTTTSAGGTIPVSQNAHVHTNWIFTAEGDYTFVVTPSLATTTHGTITGDPATYHFRIGERAPEPVTTTVAVSADAESYTEGDVATFTASQDPATELSTYRWEVAAADSGEFVPVEGQTGATYARETSLADDGAQVRVVLLDGDRVAGTSEPVTLAVAAVEVPVEHTIAITGAEESYTAGDPIRLEAVLDPAVEGATFAWEQSRQGEAFEPLDGLTGPVLETVADLAQNGVAYRASALGADGEVLATSEPVTLTIERQRWAPVELDETPVVLDEGHIDLFELTHHDGALVLAVKDDTRLHADGVVFRAPEAVTVAVDAEKSRKTVTREDHTFLGEMGSTYYALPLAQEDGLPWPGWSTERLGLSLPAGVTASDLRFEVEAEGPGEVATWMYGPFGEVVNKYVDTQDDQPDVIPVDPRSHVHTVWGFTEQGTYTLRVTAKGSLSDGTELTSDTETYIFQVGGDGPPVDPVHTVSIAPLDEWYPLDGTIELEASLEPAVEGATYRWERRMVDASEFAPFFPTVFRDASLSLLANVYAEGVTWRVVAIDAQGQELATSEPVVIPEVREVPWEAPVLDDTPVVLSEGHIDLFNLYLDAGRLVLAVVDDTRQHASRSVDRAPSAVTVAVDPGIAGTAVPESGYDFLGEPGDEVYVLPSSQTDGLPWPGWDTQRLEKSLPEGVTASDLRYEIEAAGPGSVSAWAGGLAGSPRVHFDSGDSEPDAIPVSVGAHVHTSWGFTEQGTYTLRVTAKGSLSDGTELTSDTETYTFQVGEEQPEPVTTTVTVSADAASYTEGDAATFTASQQPVTELSTYRWEVAAAGSDEFVAVAGQSGAAYERAVSLADDGARVRAVLLDGDRVAGTSAPVALAVTAAPDPGPGPNPGASEPNREYVLNKGHIDGFEVTYDVASDELLLSVKDDTGIYQASSAYRSPADVTIAYEDARGVQQLPAAQGPWSFLGAYGGQRAWIGTQTGEDQTYLPWVGWSTERLLSSLQGTGVTPAAGSPVSLAVEVEGPGDVLSFQNDSFGTPINRYVDTTASEGGTIPITSNAHVHTNWIYTAEGDYHFTVTPSLKTADGRTITGEPADYHVRVGAYVPPFEPLPEEGLTDANRGGLTLDRSSYALGEVAVASSDALTDGRKVVAYVYSEPTAAGELTAADGSVAVTIPTTVGTGAHKLALYDSATGELVGWAPLTATAAPSGDGGGSGDGSGAGTGSGAGSGSGAGAGSTTPEPCIPTPVTSEVRTGVVGGVTEGHFDVGSVVESGRLVAKTKDDRKQPPSWVDPESLTFRLGDAAKREVPAGADFAFLGEAGATIWSVGQVQEPNVPWVGWNTQHPSLIEAAAGPVTYTLDRVDGPGKLGVYATGNFGGVGTKYFGTMSGFPRSMTVPLNQHVHGNWAFSEQGVYTVSFTLSVPLKSGGTATDTASLKFSVGDSSGTATKTTYVGKTASGADCELSAEQKAALATTGADPVGALVLGVLLLVTGSALYGASRRRRGTTTA
ncbi:TIGR03773 family transporter-associated surface protein [Cellulosimicrobium cellulans]|uniref:TIGR03773 family transporter-associated surface protein n=1 Tax=Cellulosimicrobium cellulans TaxID=1710 RepID=UPI001EDA9D0E|nr:TIGR03773 family transporter-associated surface protein [Cellulosimicrobium cellulans]UKJ63324.1 TIGR03773 family transporter-associated surface protein [Cellulosimicrobium cellulans]